MSNALTRNRFSVRIVGARIPRGAVLLATGKQCPAFKPARRTVETPNCQSCADFVEVKVRVGAGLLTVTCPDPSHAVLGADLPEVVDDVERDDERDGYEAEDFAR